MHSIFFKIHSSELKPEPASDASQVAKIFEPHCVLGHWQKSVRWFPSTGCIAFEALECDSSPWRTPDSQPRGAIAQRRAVGADHGFAFEFSVTISICCIK